MLVTVNVVRTVTGVGQVVLLSRHVGHVYRPPNREEKDLWHLDLEPEQQGREVKRA
jgi:hypothetical protein